MRHQEKRCRSAVAGYARAGTRSNFEKYGLFTLFLARKFECILTNPHSLSTLHTITGTNRRCLASPEKIEVFQFFLGTMCVCIRRTIMNFLSRVFVFLLSDAQRWGESEDSPSVERTEVTFSFHPLAVFR